MGWDGMGWGGSGWNGVEWNGVEWDGVYMSKRGYILLCTSNGLHNVPKENMTVSSFLNCRHEKAKCRRLPGVAKDLMLPLVIMTSEDTDAKTREMIEREGRFGMAEGQIIIIMQDKVS